MSPHFLFSFSWKIENANWLKRKKKGNFSLWVKFKKLSQSFSAAKEKVYSPVILNQHAIYLEKKKSFSAAKEIIDSPVILNQCGI